MLYRNSLSSSPRSIDAAGDKRFRPRVMLGFALASVTALVLVGTTWKMAEDSAEADQHVAHAREVLDAVAQIRISTLGVEYSTQGFRFTGEMARLSERDAAANVRKQALEQLNRLTESSAVQQQRLKELQGVILERMAIARRVEELVRTEGTQAATEYVRTVPLLETREKANHILSDIEAHERAALETDHQLQASARNRMMSMVALMAISLLAVLAFTYYLVQRQLRRLQGAQMDLAASEDNLAITLQSIGDAVVATDTLARITRMNTVAEKLTGWSSAEATGRDVAEVFHIVHEQTRQPAAIPVNDVLASGEVRTLANHTLLISRDGTEWPIADSAAPIHDAEGHIRGVVLVFRDVTRERLAEKTVQDHNNLLELRVEERTRQLHESEVRYRTAFLTSPEAIVLTRLSDGMYLDVNEGFERIFGWKRDETIGKTSRDLGIWQSQPPRDAYLQRIREQGKAVDYEAEFLDRNKAGIVALVSSTSITIDGQDCILTVMRDVTERKRVREALLAREKEFRQLAEAMPQIVWVCEADGRNTYFNAQWVEYTGMSLEDSYGHGWNKPFHPEDQQRAWEAWQNAIHRNGSYALECRLRRADGAYLWWLVRGVPTLNENGGIAKWFGTCTNIDDLKRGAVALQESEERLNFAMEHSHLAGWDLDLETQVVQRSKGHHRVFGYPSNDIPWNVQTFMQHLLPEDRDMVQRAQEVTQRTGADLDVECRIRRADGAVRWVWVRGGLRTDMDGHRHMAGIVQDITERKRAEHELLNLRDHLQDLVAERTGQLELARRSAESASVAKSRFLANMSHEIRTPLSAIIGMSRLIRRQPLTEDQTERLDKLDTAADHLNATINDILDLSKIEAGRLTLADEPLQVSAVILRVQEMLQDRAAQKGLTITVETGALPRSLYGDETRLGQALLNYAGNAIKFTEHGGIRLRVQAIEESSDAVLLRFEVQDSGIGIDSDRLEKLFTDFEQADNTISRKYGGTGLGLAITRRLAQAMGGDAGASSTPGLGSTFWLTVRLRKGEEFALPGTAASLDSLLAQLRLRHTGRRILMAEDDPFNREVGQFLLQDCGVAVDCAEDGRAAVEKCRNHHYDLVLMDMQMPYLDGVEATRQIRRLPDRADLPIVAMTANAFSEDRENCLQAGMNDFITKPVDPQVLYTTLLRWLD